MNDRSRTWIAMLPAESSSRPSGSRRPASSGGRSEYSITWGRPSTVTTTPSFSSGESRSIDLEGHLGLGLAVQAEEGRVGDLDQRIVDLEVEERADAPLAHLLQAARRAVRAGGRQRGEGAAVAVGAECDVVLARQQDLAAGPVDRRHLPLDEEADVLQAEAVVLLEERDRRLVVLRAGHDVERQRPCRGDGPGRRSSRQWIWNRLAEETGPIGKVPLGPSYPSRVPDPPATRIDPDLAGGQGVGPDLDGPAPGHALAVGLRQPDHLDRPDPVGLDLPRRPRRAPAPRSGRRAARSRSRRSRPRAAPAACSVSSSHHRSRCPWP